MSSFEFIRYGGVLCDLFECQAGLAIFCKHQLGKCVILCCVDKKSIQTRVKALLK